MVLTVLSTVTLLLLEMSNKVKKLRWVWSTLVAMLFLLLVIDENVFVHLTGSGINTQNLWPVLILYIHLFLFNSLNHKSSDNYLGVLIPVMIFFQHNQLLQISVLLIVSFMSSKHVDKMSFWFHGLGLSLALINHFMPKLMFVSLVLYMLYSCYLLLEIYRLNMSSEFSLKKIVYVCLNLTVLHGLSYQVKPESALIINFVAIFSIIGIVLKFRASRSKIIPVTGIILILFSVLNNKLEIYQVLPLFCILSHVLFNNEEYLLINNNEVDFKYRNNASVFCLLLSGFMLIHSLINDINSTWLVGVIFSIYFFNIIVFEHKDKKVFKSDVAFMALFLVNLVGVFCLS